MASRMVTPNGASFSTHSLYSLRCRSLNDRPEVPKFSCSINFLSRTVSASLLSLKNCRLRPLPIFGQVTHHNVRPLPTFTFLRLVAVLRMVTKDNEKRLYLS